jgi:hypothetical protein
LSCDIDRAWFFVVRAESGMTAYRARDRGRYRITSSRSLLARTE